MINILFLYLAEYVTPKVILKVLSVHRALFPAYIMLFNQQPLGIRGYTSLKSLSRILPFVRAVEFKFKSAWDANYELFLPALTNIASLSGSYFTTKSAVNLLLLLPNLKFLELNGNDGLLPDIHIINSLAGLKTLKLDNFNNITNLWYFESLMDLTSLSLVASPVENLGPLTTKFKNLAKLDLSDCKKLRHFDELKFCIQLKELILNKLVTFDSLRPIVNLKNLEVLSLENTSITNLDMPILSGL
ncbi:hypothetical protein HK100_008722, partial [Physocladia obscura]